MRSKKLKLLLPALFFFTISGMHAQIPDLPVTRDSLYSAVLKEGRRLEVVLPAGYDPTSAEKYDVLYVTDGEWNTRIVSNIRQFLNIQFIPENIIVSIPNVYPNNMNQRGRDFTPTHIDGMPESGGADKFLSFIKTELLPYINNKYKTTGENTFYGSSLGGIFAIYLLCKAPELFQSYLVADPALWWDHNYINTLLKENLDKIKLQHRTLLVTGREGAPFQFMGIASADSILHMGTPGTQHWKLLLYSDETHNSMIFRTVYDGLKFTYAGYAKEEIVFHPMNGILLKDKPVTLRRNSDISGDLYFTTDGTEPTTASSKVAGDTISLNNPSGFRVKSISNREKYSKTTTGNFKVAAALPSSSKPKNTQAGGWQYTYYEGVWDSLPDFKKLQALRSGITDTAFNVARLSKQKNFAVLMTGQLEVKTDGYYIFGIDADGGAKLFLGNQLLINYNGIHSSGKFQSFIVPLVKGFYPVRVEYFQQHANPSLNLLYITPGNNNPTPIPPELEYSLSKK